MSVAQQNRTMLGKLLVIVVMMAGFGYALVPMYKKICEVTGISASKTVNAAPARNTQVDTTRLITIEFVAATNQQMPWRFEPLKPTVELHPGEVVEMRYRVVNTTDKNMTGQAVASYGPAYAGKYLNKLECFCFKQQTLAAHETREMPVVFRLSPELPPEVRTVTLSYTFFDVTG
jgi:cytochrome c oxidase assembly protein subunit 11